MKKFEKKKKMNEIRFYEKNNEYYEFSNFFDSSFELNNVKYRNVEQYFQAQKFNDLEDEDSIEYFNLIIEADSPQKVKSLGSQKVFYRGNNWCINKNKPELGLLNDIITKFKNKVSIVDDWDDIKDKIMYKGLKKKFKNEDLKQLLLDTDDKILIEDSPRDYYWGIGKDDTGENKLGELLMKLRKRLLKKINIINDVKMPHSRCNPINTSKTIIIGAEPIPETIDAIINFNFDIIINLKKDPVEPFYVKNLPTNTEYIYLPTPPGKAPNEKKALELINVLINSNKKIYIHCSGGHGRAACFGALLIGKQLNIDTTEVVEKIEKYRELREDKSRNFIPTPETTSQINFLIKNLGVNNSNIIPDRSDRSWLKKLKKS